jgi:hypothetical protein
MSGIAAGFSPTEVYAAGTRGVVSMPHSLGDIRHINEKAYIFAQADGAITANDVCLVDASNQADQLDTTNSGSGFGLRCGVAAATLADNEYGWVQIYGPCTVNVATSCAANTALNSTATAGRIDDDATSGAEVVSGLVTTAAEASNTAAAYLNYPTVGATL